MIADSPDIAVREQDAVAVVTFSRPPLNYFDVSLVEALATTLEQLDANTGIRAVVLGSEGKTFCAGAKFSAPDAGSAGTAAAGAFADPSTLYKTALRLFRTRKPIIAAVQGAAIGGGLGLALAADFRVATPEARFAGNFTRLGIHPGFGITHTLPRIVGNQNAALLLYTSRRIDGVEAQNLGLVDLLVPLEELQSAAIALAAEIAEGAPLALEATRATLRQGLADAVAAQVDHECREQVTLFATNDFKEGIAAVAERRPGRWTRS